MTRMLLICLIALQFLAACTRAATPATTTLTLSIVGTNDVHGNLSQREGRGGLTTLSGYVNTLRSVREEEGGAVLLIDAGDMWQGTLESNMTEGAAVVAAFNAMGYDAAAIGNHEFDFGPLGPDAIPASPDDDPRGALKQRATEARFPFLAANLIDEETNRPVDWSNVRPSVMVEAAGLSIGIIGIITKNALRATIAANVVGLRIAPLAATIEKEAKRLRAADADLIIVAAHAGSRCEDFDDPFDLSSCNQTGEIFEVANALPTGLVDHIIAGHVHEGIAHIANDTVITSSYSNTVAFSRVDFVFESNTHRLLDRIVFPPTKLIAAATYEGAVLDVDGEVAAIADRTARFAEEQKNRPVGVYLETSFTLDGNPESTLGNLFTDAMLESLDADIAIHNVAGGLRQDLPSGDLTFGNVYEMSPFENYVVVIELTGAELRQIVAEQSRRGDRSMGFSGMRVIVKCGTEELSVELRSDNGDVIADDDKLKVIVNDYLALGGDKILASVTPDGGFPIDSNMPLSRDLFLQWLANRGESLDANDYDTSTNPKWTRPDSISTACRTAALSL